MSHRTHSLAAWLVALALLLVAPTADARRKGPELVLQLGHTGGIIDADVVRQGRGARALTLGKDGHLKVWDAVEGTLLADHALVDPRQPVRITGSRGGDAALVWMSRGGPVRVDLTTGAGAAVKLGVAEGPLTVCPSPDRRRVAVSYPKAGLVLYSLPELEEVARPKLKLPGRGTRCAFDAKGRVLALGSSRGEVTWLDVSRGLAPIDHRKLDSLMIDDLAASPAEPGVWAVRGRKHMVIWDVRARKERARYNASGSHGFVRWTADGKHLVDGAHGSRAVHLRDVATGRKLDEVADDVVVPEGRLDSGRWVSELRGVGALSAAVRLDDPNVEIWRIGRSQRVASLLGHPAFITALSFFEDGRHVALGTSIGRVNVWDLPGTSRTPTEWSGHRQAVTAIALSADGAWAATGDAGGQVLVRKRATGEVDRKLKAQGAVQGLAFLADGVTLVIQGSAGVSAWRVDFGLEVPLPEGAGQPKVAAWAPDGGRLWVARGDKLLLVEGGEVRELASERAAISGLSVTPDGERLLVVLADGTAVERGAGKGKVRRRLKAPGAIARLSAAPRGDVLAGVSSDQRVWLWAGDAEEPQLTWLVDAAGEWVAWTEEGAFDASEGGGRYVAWRAGGRVLPLERFRERMQVPSLVQSVLGGQLSRVDVDADDADFRPPPVVRVTGPAPGTRTERDLIGVTVEVEDAGGGIAEVRLYHQGRLVADASDAAPQAGKRRRYAFDVALESGRNRLQARATSEGRVQSRSAPVDVVRAAGPGKVGLKLLAVGINNYKDPDLRLTYAAPDARAVVAALADKPGSLFEAGVTQRLLVDEQATRQAVLDGLDWLVKDTRPDDLAVIYLAGHGDTAGDEYYFLPQDLIYRNLDSLAAGGISRAELQDHIRRIPARKVVVLLDTCHSGSVFTGLAARGIGRKKALSVLGQAAGVYLLAASTSRQQALEDAELGHGLFTWALLEGLQGKADLDRDQAVSIRELVGWVETRVADLSAERFGAAQYPVTHGTGRSFPLALVPR